MTAAAQEFKAFSWVQSFGRHTKAARRIKTPALPHRSRVTAIVDGGGDTNRACSGHLAHPQVPRLVDPDSRSRVRYAGTERRLRYPHGLLDAEILFCARSSLQENRPGPCRS